MTAVLDLAGCERAEVRFLELEMWATVTRLNLSDFELVVVARLRSDGLERVVILAVFEQAAAAASPRKFALAVILDLCGLEQKVARPRSDGIERAAAGLRGLCGLAAKPNLDDLERAAVGLCEPGTQTAVAARLSACGVVRTGAVREVEVEIRVARRPRKTTHRRLSCVYVAEGGVCRCYVELDACGKSVAAVRLSCALSRARALVAR